MQRKSRVCLIVVLIVAAVLGAVVTFFPRIRHQSSGAATAECAAKVTQLAAALRMLADKGELPRDQEEFVKRMKAEYGPELLMCPFAKHASCSYTYLWSKEVGADNTGGRVMLYCSAQHPIAVRSADGDRGKGWKLVLRSDFTTSRTNSDAFVSPR